jgi:hypothetical protein
VHSTAASSLQLKDSTLQLDITAACDLSHTAAWATSTEGLVWTTVSIHSADSSMRLWAHGLVRLHSLIMFGYRRTASAFQAVAVPAACFLLK